MPSESTAEARSEAGREKRVNSCCLRGYAAHVESIKAFAALQMAACKKKKKPDENGQLMGAAGLGSLFRSGCWV